MNVSSALSAIQYNAALSSLRSASRQPELALELLLKSIQGIQPSTSAHLSPAKIQSSASPPDTGRTVDIIA